MRCFALPNTSHRAPTMCAPGLSSCFFFQQSAQFDTLSSNSAYHLLVFFKMKNTLQLNSSTPSDNSFNHPNSEFSRALPFLDFVYHTDGINGVAQLYRSVLCQSNFKNPEKVCIYTHNFSCLCKFSLLCSLKFLLLVL